jgi:hypothetical protein
LTFGYIAGLTLAQTAQTAKPSAAPAVHPQIPHAA